MNFVSFGKVMTEPFADNSARIETIGDGEFKVAKLANTKATLVPLTVVSEAVVVYGNEVLTIGAGTKVWTRASNYAAPWGQERFTVNGTTVILVPFDRIEFLEQDSSASNGLN